MQYMIQSNTDIVVVFSSLVLQFLRIDVLTHSLSDYDLEAHNVFDMSF